MKESRDQLPWRYISCAAVMIAVAVAVYTIGFAFASFDQFLEWLNTLISTMLSVFSALVVGLVLYRVQTREADCKRRDELAGLLETELGELESRLLDSRTVVPEEVLEDQIPSASHNIRLSIHHPHPLVTEDAARSGLFGAEPTAEMLALARDMRSHEHFLREATSLEPHMDRAYAAGLAQEAGREEFFRLLRRYAQAARMVQLSEESMVAGCGRVLDGLGRTPGQ